MCEGFDELPRCVVYDKHHPGVLFMTGTTCKKQIKLPLSVAGQLLKSTNRLGNIFDVIMSLDYLNHHECFLKNFTVLGGIPEI